MTQIARKVGGVWVVESPRMLGVYRLDQRQWSEADLDAAGLYSDTVKPFDVPPVPGAGQKLDGGAVVDGRVVWSLVALTAEEIALQERQAAEAVLQASDLGNPAGRKVEDLTDFLIESGLFTEQDLAASKPELAQWRSDRKAARVVVGG